MVTFLSVVGARPNFMKVAPLHRALLPYEGRIQHIILHTGQHYDEKMSRVFFEDLELPHPDVYLGVGSGTHAEQTARIMVEFETAALAASPDLVIVVGDVNSTLACSVTCSKLGIPVAHVESGLRSFDRTMPEEINRMVTDILSDFLFVTEPAGVENLAREGVAPEKVHLVGDVMIDALMRYREKARSSRSMDELGVAPRGYTLVTLHRPSNVDVRERLEIIAGIFERLQDATTIVFPVHPRTRRRMDEFGLAGRFDAIRSLRMTDPIGYLDFLNLMDNAALVLTDSGGIQEETTYLQVPCLTMRENTERPVTIDVGTNQLVGLDADLVVTKSMEALGGWPKRGRIPDMWDGNAAERIIRILATAYGAV